MWFLTAFYLYKALFKKKITISKNSAVYDVLVRGKLLKQIYKANSPEPIVVGTGSYIITTAGKEWLIKFERNNLTWLISICALIVSILAYLKK
ncbi:hypothetical protein [Paucilactobacillus sp. N302-9]